MFSSTAKHYRLLLLYYLRVYTINILFLAQATFSFALESESFENIVYAFK